MDPTSIGPFLKELIKYGWAGAVVGIVVFFVVAFAAIAYAGSKRIWTWGSETLNYLKLYEQERDGWAEYRAKVDRERVEAETRHDAELRTWQTLALMTGKELRHANDNTEKSIALAQTVVEKKAPT